MHLSHYTPQIRSILRRCFLHLHYSTLREFVTFIIWVWTTIIIKLYFMTWRLRSSHWEDLIISLLILIFRKLNVKLLLWILLLIRFNHILIYIFSIVNFYFNLSKSKILTALPDHRIHRLRYLLAYVYILTYFVLKTILDLILTLYILLDIIYKIIIVAWLGHARWTFVQL